MATKCVRQLNVERLVDRTGEKVINKRREREREREREGEKEREREKGERKKEKGEKGRGENMHKLNRSRVKRDNY